MAERHPRLNYGRKKSCRFLRISWAFLPMFLETRPAKVASVATSLFSSRQAAYQYNTSAGSPASSLSHNLSLSSYPNVTGIMVPP